VLLLHRHFSPNKKEGGLSVYSAYSHRSIGGTKKLDLAQQYHTKSTSINYHKNDKRVEWGEKSAGWLLFSFFLSAVVCSVCIDWLVFILIDGVYALMSLP
jgi:hypothetical protein